MKKMSTTIGRMALMMLIVAGWAGQVEAAPTILLKSAPSGVPLTGTNNAVSMNLGAANGLAAGTPAAGVVIALKTAGPVYSSDFTVSLNGFGGGASISVTAYVSSNFAHAASSAITAMQCQAADCTVDNSEQPLSTSSGSPTVIRSGLADKATFTSNVGALVAYLNGGSAFTGADSASIIFQAIDSKNNTHSDTVTLTITTTVQQAVQLALDTAGTISIGPGGSSDFAADFGAVDGLGASSGNGAAMSRSTSPLGARYSSTYRITPAFSSMPVTQGTVRMYVSSNFAHPSLLQAQDSGDGTSFSAISTNSTFTQQTLISGAAQSKAPITRYLGLFVFNINGADAYSGSDSATITYTVIVP